MRLLTVPNWSFGRDRRLLLRFREILEESDVTIHYCESDVDHNRTVTGFSGDPSALIACITLLCEEAFDRIDLNRHVGVHPRIGALDVCPFVLLPSAQGPESLEEAQATVEVVGRVLAESFEVPVFLYEKSERGRHEADLPTLRKGGFGGLLGKVLRPDFGSSAAHPRLGVSVVGVRDFLLAINANLDTQDLSLAAVLAKQIRTLRQAGDQRFLGVRALGLPLASRKQVQVSMNLTLPDITPVDPILEWIVERAAEQGVALAEAELIGVIRPRDLESATRLPFKQQQVVE